MTEKSGSHFVNREYRETCAANLLRDRLRRVASLRLGVPTWVLHPLEKMEHRSATAFLGYFFQKQEDSVTTKTEAQEGW